MDTAAAAAQNNGTYPIGIRSSKIRKYHMKSYERLLNESRGRHRTRTALY